MRNLKLVRAGIVYPLDSLGIELIAKQGDLVNRTGEHLVDISRRKPEGVGQRLFVYRVQNGKVGAPVKGATLIGDGATARCAEPWPRHGPDGCSSPPPS